MKEPISGRYIVATDNLVWAVPLEAIAWYEGISNFQREYERNPRSYEEIQETDIRVQRNRRQVLLMRDEAIVEFARTVNVSLLINQHTHVIANRYRDMAFPDCYEAWHQGAVEIIRNNKDTYRKITFPVEGATWSVPVVLVKYLTIKDCIRGGLSYAAAVRAIETEFKRDELILLNASQIPWRLVEFAAVQETEKPLPIDAAWTQAHRMKLK
jgi:hypothetical protein